MKKLAIVLLVSISALCFVASAFAGTIKPGEQTSCNNSKAISLEAAGSSSVGDRGNANAVIWKSSNYTTIPISLGPSDTHGLKGARGVGMSNKQSQGRKAVVLKHQNNFSRGDSIGDISGLVKITNTGTVPINVNCG
ncbi:MAG: hypothetical protein ACE5E9_11065 [Nitrospinaceae bacterium]